MHVFFSYILLLLSARSQPGCTFLYLFPKKICVRCRIKISQQTCYQSIPWGPWTAGCSDSAQGKSVRVSGDGTQGAGCPRSVVPCAQCFSLGPSCGTWREVAIPDSSIFGGDPGQGEHDGGLMTCMEQLLRYEGYVKMRRWWLFWVKRTFWHTSQTYVTYEILFCGEVLKFFFNKSNNIGTHSHDLK